MTTSNLSQGTDTDFGICSLPWQWFALGKGDGAL